MNLCVDKSYKNRMVKKQRVHTLPTTPDFHEGFGIEGSMWDQEGLASRMVIDHTLDAWGSADGDEATKDSSGPQHRESSDQGDDSGSSHHPTDSDGGKGVAFEESDDSTSRKAAKKARKKKAERRQSSAKEMELTAEVARVELVAASSASLLQRELRKNGALIRDRAEELPRVNGDKTKAKKSMRKLR
jgi:hypothetical protein